MTYQKGHPGYWKGKKGAVSGMKGKHHTEECKRKQRELKKGTHTGEENGMFGKHHTEEAKKKMAEKRGGENNPMYGRKGEANPFFGKRHTEKTKENQSKSAIGLHSGEKNGQWKGGISFLPYCHKFNEKLKHRIRARDNFTCQLCGKEGHSVHHVHYDKENCYPDLITLCYGCNTKANFYRDYYESLFMNILNNRGLLFWIKYESQLFFITHTLLT